MTIREYTRPKSETYAQQRMKKIKEAQLVTSVEYQRAVHHLQALTF